MPEAFVDGLDAQTRSRVVDLLNANLADTVALTLAVKEAHWNVKGPGFIGFHELLDEVADRLRESSDTLAERAVVLGGLAKGTAETVAGKSRLEPYPQDLVDLQGHAKELKDRFLVVGAQIRKAIDEAGEAGDEGTADAFTEISRQIDQDAWFIGAHAA